MTIAEFFIAAQVNMPFVIMALAVFLSLIVLGVAAAKTILYKEAWRSQGDEGEKDFSFSTESAYRFMNTLGRHISVDFSAFLGCFSFEITSNFSGAASSPSAETAAVAYVIPPSAPPELEALIENGCIGDWQVPPYVSPAKKQG
jgi:hypothetical protein